MNLSEYGDYPDLSNVRKTLVIILRNIGDVLLASPVFTVLKSHLPNALIDALVNSGTEEVLLDNPNVNKIHVINRPALKAGIVPRLREEIRVFRDIRSARYDLTISLTSGNRGKMLGWLSGAGIRVGAGSNKRLLFCRTKLLTVTVRHAPANRHYVERHLDCLRRIGIFPKAEQKCLAIYEGDEATSRIRYLMTKSGVARDDPYVVVHPTSRWMFKTWPLEKMAALIDLIRSQLGMSVVVTSSPDSLEMSYIVEMLKYIESDVINLSGSLSLRELSALIRGARLFIGIDSAPMHISAAVGTSVVALFGPSSERDWGPWGSGHRIVVSDAHPCRPCQIDGCGGSKVSECLTSLDVDAIFLVVKKQLGAQSYNLTQS